MTEVGGSRYGRNIEGQDDGILAVDAKQIPPLVKRFAVDNGVRFGSCMDVGGGRARKDLWFRKFSHSIEPRDYTCIETDEQIMAELRSHDVDVRHPERVGAEEWELALALEVIEHVREDETESLLDFICSHTSGLVALTTPNIEYWELGGTGEDNRNVLRLRPEPKYDGLRFIPDHAHQYDPASGSPHTHKQLFTPESLRRVLCKTFTKDRWGVQVYRAWPWEVRDIASGFAYKLYFKLFALVWRRDFVEVPSREL